ncbi:hypothetical protein Slin15195_G023570 [Septoria linicola]|uniref:Uncharacterized protein n=1 Tax=Septoria linicola TaxID=215465 RepID=A0A9Q9EH80_9PEZI|nr:hypothetical protein Slin14017_G022650 [Septoria linicola]USW49038.1 hypothetical protein Slin15195_G023570 [Septoria linicola]
MVSAKAILDINLSTRIADLDPSDTSDQPIDSIELSDQILSSPTNSTLKHNFTCFCDAQMDVSQKQPSVFHRLPEEILSLIVLQFDGQSVDTTSLKSVRLTHPRLGHLEQTKQSLFRTLPLPPRPDQSLWRSVANIAPYVQELVLVPCTAWYDQRLSFDEFFVKVGAEMVSRLTGKWLYAEPSGELGSTVSILKQLEFVETITFHRGYARTACQLDGKCHDALIILYFVCLTLANIKAKQIFYKTAVAPLRTSDPYNVHEEAWGWNSDPQPSYNDSWKIAWYHINLQSLKIVHIDARSGSPLQALVVLQTAFGRNDAGLERLSTTRLPRAAEPFSFPLWCLPCGGPNAPFRHWFLDGGAVDFGHLAVWIAGSKLLTEITLRDVFDDADTGGWFLLLQAVRQHPNRIQVRLEKIQIGSDKSITNLEHHTADVLPVHEDEYCSMIMRYMSGVGEWDCEIGGPI